MAPCQSVWHRCSQGTDALGATCIGLDASPWGCHHCSTRAEDTAFHTLVERPSWYKERRILSAELESGGSLPTVVKEMVESKFAWNSVAFCEPVHKGGGGEWWTRYIPLAPNKPVSTRPAGQTKAPATVNFRWWRVVHAPRKTSSKSQPGGRGRCCLTWSSAKSRS